MVFHLPNANKSEARRQAKPLRIAHLIQYFKAGGLERMVQKLAVGGQSHLIDSVVVAYVQDGPFRDELQQSGVRAVFFNEGDGLHYGFPIRLARWLKKEKIDVLHTHHLGPYMYGALAARLAGIEVVHTEHSHELYDRRRRRWLGRSMRYMATVIAVTPELTRFRAEHFGHSVPVILNGVDVPDLKEGSSSQARRMLCLPADAFVIGCVARLSHEKDHQLLLDGFVRFCQTSTLNARLLLVGDGPLAAQVEKKVRSLPTHDRIHLLGYRNDVREILPAFDIVSLTSRREGLPLCLLEAMAQAIPVVSTAVGGVVDLLADGGGLLVPPGDVSALAQAFLLLADRPSQRKQLGKQAREAVIKLYSSQHMIEQYVALYRRLA